MLIRRVAPGGVLDLGPRGRRQIDIQYVGQPDEVDQHIRQLLAGPGPKRFRGGTSYRIIRRQPLEQLGELAHLPHQRQYQRLRVVEPGSVALLGERTHPVAKIAQIRHASDSTR